jgi:hypothetical protein
LGTTLGRRDPGGMLDRPVGPEPAPGRRVATVALPLAVFAAWRLAHAVVVVVAGGSLVDTTFSFDATYYLAIARHGYVVTDPTYADPQTIAFFPAFPALALPFVAVLGATAGGALVANLLAAGSFVTVWGAARDWYGDRVAALAVITLACWPGSFYLWAFYSEGLFVVVTAAALWADRSGRARLAVVLVLVAGLTRSPGLLLGPVLVLARVWVRRRIDPVAVAYAGASLAAAGILVLIGRVAADDALAFSHAQRGWGRSFAAPWVPVVDGVHHQLDVLPRLAGETAMNMATTGLLLALGVGGLAVALRRRSDDDRPVTPALWTLAATLLPQFTLLLTSMVRLALGAWTAFVLLALALRDRPVMRAGVWIAGAALSVIVLRRIAGGVFVA